VFLVELLYSVIALLPRAVAVAALIA